MESFINYFFYGVVLYVILGVIHRTFRAHPESSEYLEALSYTEWRNYKEIRAELAKGRKKKICSAHMCKTLHILEEQGYAERDICPQVVGGQTINRIVFRRKSAGGPRRKIQQTQKEVVPDPGLATA